MQEVLIRWENFHNYAFTKSTITLCDWARIQTSFFMFFLSPSSISLIQMALLSTPIFFLFVQF